MRLSSGSVFVSSSTSNEGRGDSDADLDVDGDDTVDYGRAQYPSNLPISEIPHDGQECGSIEEVNIVAHRTNNSTREQCTIVERSNSQT